MAQTVEQALKNAKLVTDGKSYTLLRLPSHAILPAAHIMAQLSEPFSALIVDKDESTLIIPSDALQTFASRLRDTVKSEQEYRLITFDTTLELSLVGFMARVSQSLATAGVSILPYAAYTRDHLLVPSEQFERAWAVLETLQSGI